MTAAVKDWNAGLCGMLYYYNIYNYIIVIMLINYIIVMFTHFLQDHLWPAQSQQLCIDTATETKRCSTFYIHIILTSYTWYEG